MKEPKLGRYQHFKGREYELLAIAIHSETGEKMAVYRALYQEQKLWVRPLEMWEEWVEKEEYRGPRFSLLEEKK